jgi:hypothetical protein
MNVRAEVANETARRGRIRMTSLQQHRKQQGKLRAEHRLRTAIASATSDSMPRIES